MLVRARTLQAQLAPIVIYSPPLHGCLPGLRPLPIHRRRKKAMPPCRIPVIPSPGAAPNAMQVGMCKSRHINEDGAIGAKWRANVTSIGNKPGKQGGDAVEAPPANSIAVTPTG